MNRFKKSASTKSGRKVGTPRGNSINTLKWFTNINIEISLKQIEMAKESAKSKTDVSNEVVDLEKPNSPKT